MLSFNLFPSYDNDDFENISAKTKKKPKIVGNIPEKVRNIVAKEEIACFGQFLLCHNVFKSCLL